MPPTLELDLDEIYHFALNLAKNASELLDDAWQTRCGASKRSDVTGIEKDSAVDVVTKTDEDLEAFIWQQIFKKYPTHQFVGEESYSRGSSKDYLITNEPTWCIDPLDGTVNYLHLFPMFCISIAFILDGEPVVGVVTAPFLKQTFSACKGKGAWLNETRRLPLIRDPIPPMPETAPKGCIFSCEWGKDRKDQPDGNLHRKVESFMNMAAELGSRDGKGGMVHGVRSLGSATLDLAYCAMGAFDIWWEGGCWEWDVAAGICLVKEAGGLVTSANPPADVVSSPIEEAKLGGRLYLAIRPAGDAVNETARQGQERTVREVWRRLNILVSTIKENNFDTQAEKIRRLVDANGMEVFTTYFRRLLQSNASTIFPSSSRPAASTDSAGSYQMLVQEMQKILTESQQAEKIAQSLDTNEGEIFRDFDFSAFIDHFGLGLISKTVLADTCRTTSKQDLRSKADSIFTNNFPNFISALAAPNGPNEEDIAPTVLASMIQHIGEEPPRRWNDDSRENFRYAVRMRYRSLNSRTPEAVESALFRADLLDSPQDSRLARVIRSAGSRGTASLEACKDVLAGVETRDISYLQIANALLFMVMSQTGEGYNANNFVEALRQHRAGPKIDWTDVVNGFDQEDLRITKKQFLELYNALIPLAREYANFDIQSLWGGQWQFPETQLGFVVAFLSTTPDELDVLQIPDLRQAFQLADYEDAPENVKLFAADAVKHPLVSRDATEALFTMIFRSPETYGLAQILGIPETLINPNMTIFVCAASATPKPWAALQDQALKQLFYPFLVKQHENFDFVMHSLWMHDKAWVAGRMLDFYNSDPMLLVLIYQHAVEHGWLELLLTISATFVIDLATYAHGKGQCDLIEWAKPNIASTNPQAFSQAMIEFLRKKLDDELLVQREKVARSTVRLELTTIYTLLMMMGDLMNTEDLGTLYRQCLAMYPRLFNYGEDEARDTLIEANGELSNTLPEEAGSQMEERYKSMYSGSATPDQVITELKKLKTSENPADQELFAAMLHGLFDEYNCFGEYPNEALATTAVLFGGLIQFKVLSGIAEQAAIYNIFEAVSEYGPDDPMYRFGLQAMIHLLGRLKEWPHLAERILHTPSLRGTQAIPAAEAVLKELDHETEGLNGDVANGLTNGALDEDFQADASNQPFASLHVDPPFRPDLYEEPNEDVSDKVMFVLNNVSKRNLEEKFKDLQGTLDDRHHQWFAHYLVEDLAKSQPNFQGLYLQLLETFDKNMLWAEVLRETYVSCAKMLNAQSTMESTTERTNLKNLAGWLGSLTLARDRPILHRNISFKDLLIEGHDTQRLLVAIPFTCKALIHAAHSKVFRPPNPWLMELLGLLSELYHCFDLRLNLKFEIEVLCKDLNMDVKTIEPLDIIRSRPHLHENNMMQQYAPEGPEGFGDMHLIGLSKRAPNERFSPAAVIEALPDLGSMLQIPTATGNVTQPQLRGIFINAAQQAIYEIIAPVVERSVTIAAISTAELIQKDFATEADVEKLRSSAHTVVKALSGSLALVTCKEPLRMSIMNNIRILASGSLPSQLPEGQIIMFVNDNIDTVCSLVERAAEEHSLAEIDAQLAQAISDRRQHNEQRPNEGFNNPPVSRWARLIPEPFRQDPEGVNANGLNRQQLALYEDFGRQARIAPAAHATSGSIDANRQLPDVLSDSYLPSLPTPAEVPPLPRQTPQSQRLQAMQPQGPQVNGYADTPNIGQRTLELMQDLQQAAREASENHIIEIAEAAPIRQIYEQLVNLIESAVQKDQLAVAAGQQCFLTIYGDAQKRLEVEIFVRLLSQLCRISVPAGRHLTMYLASTDEEKLFNTPATIALLNEGLLDLQQVDVQAARAVSTRRPPVLGFLKELFDDILLGENPLALRADFVLTFESLSQWLVDEPSNAGAQEIISMLRSQNTQQNGLPSPPQSDKHDQMEYLFEEWIRLQRKETPDRSYLAFIWQLDERRVIADPKDAMMFWRACLELSCAAFENVTSAPYPQDLAYIHMDALAKLIAFMVIYQKPSSQHEVSRAGSLDAILRLVILVMNDHHNKQKERFNGRVYFRLFSTLLVELNAGKALLGQEEQDVYSAFATALQVMQPRYFPGFVYPWLSLISHRLLVPVFLQGAGRSNGGWTTYTKVLCTLLTALGELLAVDGSAAVTQELFRGAMRLFLMLHHDFPDFLVENHLQLNSSIPPQLGQLHNLLNSAVPRQIINDQPDPFTPGLKINRLEQVRQQPVVQADLDKILSDAGIKDAVARACVSDATDADFNALLHAVEGTQGQVQVFLCNALVLFVGVRATSASSVFSSGAAPARLLERILRAVQPESRYQLISAMINQVRYVSAHTQYFSTAVQHMFTTGSEDLQQQIMRVLVERLLVPRPHPWGIIVMVLEMVKNPAYDIWAFPWMETAPQVKSMLMNLAQSQDRVQRSPLGADMM
ncbi:general negative regulator of transcription subunit 1 [Acrodontium crateriforme]|uniref:General negative regulator of transcription subunit 1 n=1 Tax=Acrodontium crateriforme TaxID=150365 RepID=A0AAQ3M1M4_9PEZI|nr:general negative regulator of transcription subunit 1 [Acrodontium crateriforme]